MVDLGLNFGRSDRSSAIVRNPFGIIGDPFPMKMAAEEEENGNVAPTATFINVTTFSYDFIYFRCFFIIIPPLCIFKTKGKKEEYFKDDFYYHKWLMHWRHTIFLVAVYSSLNRFKWKTFWDSPGIPQDRQWIGSARNSFGSYAINSLDFLAAEIGDWRRRFRIVGDPWWFLRILRDPCWWKQRRAGENQLIFLFSAKSWPISGSSWYFGIPMDFLRIFKDLPEFL